MSILLGNILVWVVTGVEDAIGDPLGWRYIGLGMITIFLSVWILTFLPVSFWQGLRARKGLLKTNKGFRKQANYFFLLIMIISILLVFPLFSLFGWSFGILSPLFGFLLDLLRK